MITNLGRYTIEEELGRGGMGVVYRARDTKLGKIVAVKVLAEGRGVGADSRSRFRHEARAAAVLNHPSIVAVFDYDEQDGVPFIVSEYVEGKSLDKLIAEDSLTEDEIVDIGVQIARALAYAHERGILHRDIKPQNIIVRKDGVAKILDFGLAKKAHLDFAASDGTTLESPSFATAVGTLVGTPQYMSPEQIGGEILDGRTDIFSFGIVLYEMASGKNPFQGTSFASTVGRIMSANAPNLPDESCQYSEGLCNVVIRCLQKKTRRQVPKRRGTARRPGKTRKSIFAAEASKGRSDK